MSTFAISQSFMKKLLSTVILIGLKKKLLELNKQKENTLIKFCLWIQFTLGT